MSTAHSPSDGFMVEITGERASPFEVDTLAFLQFASSYIELVSLTAAEALDDEAGLTFTGVQVLDKCVAVAARVSDPDVAQEAAAMAAPWVRGTSVPPRVLAPYVSRAQEARRRFPSFQEARVIVGPWSMPIEAAALQAVADSRRASRTTLRARLLRVGGKEPRARFESRTEPRPFSLRVTPELARMLGPSLYQDVEIVVSVIRDADDAIVEGSLLEAVQVKSGTPQEIIQAWRDFHKRVGSEWDEIDNIKAVLNHD